MTASFRISTDEFFRIQGERAAAFFEGNKSWAISIREDPSGPVIVHWTPEGVGFDIPD